jgi:1,6-anhydro-N-acetylmuramate kinase
MGNVRRALGIQVGKLKEGEAPAAPQGDAAVAAARAALRPEIVAILGVGAVVVITWLMFSKPF